MNDTPTSRFMTRSQMLRGLGRYFQTLIQVWGKELLIAALLPMVSGAALAAQILLTRGLIASLLPSGVVAGRLPPILAAGAVASLTSLVGFLGIVFSWRQQLLTEILARHFGRMVLEVCHRTEMEKFESATFQDRLLRAQMTATARPAMLSNGALALAQRLFAVCGLSIGLLIVESRLLVLFLLSLVPLWFASRTAGGSMFAFFKNTASLERRRTYAATLMTSVDSAKEIKHYGLGPYLCDLYDHLCQQRIYQLRHYLGQQTRAIATSSLVTNTVNAASVLFITYLVAAHQIGLAEAGAAATASFLLTAQLSALIAAFSQLYEASLHIADLEEFLDLHTATAPPPSKTLPTAFADITVSEVWFRYPLQEARTDEAGWVQRDLQTLSRNDLGDPRLALADVSLEIRRGECIALVGENGSGKSTLAKLLCGLYRPLRGRILWDGLDTAEVSAQEIHTKVAVVFQDFIRYLLSVRENIGFGQVDRMPDLDGIILAARRAGAAEFIEAWAEAYEAKLGPIFGGRDLSLGQWQRIALARAFFRDAPLVILDEPTASLDARAEHELFRRTRRLFEGRTALIISHRFSTVRSADRIYVMREGRIAQSGSHGELMEADGLYRDLFMLQSQGYLALVSRA